MAKDKGKSNGEGQGVGKSVYLYKVDADSGKATFARLQFDSENEQGETLVRTSEDVIRVITDAILNTESPRVRKALAKSVKQDVRGTVRNGEAFVSTEVVFDKVLDNLSEDKPGKPGRPVKTGPVDDEDEDEEETEPTEPVTTEVPVQPWQA